MKSKSRPRRLLFTADNGVCVEMYRPLTARLAADARLSLNHAAYLKHSRDSFVSTADPVKWLNDLDLPGRKLHYRTARWLPFDACITPSFNDRLQPKNARMTIQIFHGVSFKNYCIKEKALRYDRLYLPGQYHRRRYVESGLFEDDDPRLRVIGLPKLDRLVDGTYRRDAVLRGLGLDPALDTVLFAPTGDRGNSLSYHGERLLETLRRLPLNVIVKPHDHSRRDENGVDWHARLTALETERFKAVLRSDIVPLLVAADLLITDASSVAFEYALRDRPIVFMDVPEILEGPRAHRFDLGTWGRKAGHIVSGPDTLTDELYHLLESPDEKSELRRALARDVFHEPGNATTRALTELYRDLEIDPLPEVLDPTLAVSTADPRPGPAKIVTRRPRRIRDLAVAAAAIAGAALVIDTLEPAAAAVASAAETQMHHHGGDRPDDMCIYVDPTDARESRVIVADEALGLRVFDLDGHETQRVEIGPQTHVDARRISAGSGPRTTLIVSSSAERDQLSFHVVDPTSRRLDPVASNRFRTTVTARGLCLYRSPADDATYVFVVGRHPEGDHRMEQWSVVRSAAGVDCRFVRALPIGGRAEGCVADDVQGLVFVAEEGVGIWKYPADPTDEGPRVLVDRSGLTGHLRGDVEGLAILGTSAGEGYLIASSQGSDDLVVYRRGGDNEYVGRFELVAHGDVDAVTRTEGIDGVVADLGGVFHGGLLAAHDSTNGDASPNVKLVAWSSVVDALDLR